jgi:hypothetical protein
MFNDLERLNFRRDQARDHNAHGRLSIFSGNFYVVANDITTTSNANGSQGGSRRANQISGCVA